MNPAIGIDLGTTNTVVAYQTNDTGAELLKIPQPTERRTLLEAVDLLKSVVFFESTDSVVVGEFAARRRLGAFRSIKSKMGTRWRASHPYAPDVVLTPAQVSAYILRATHRAIASRFPGWDGRAIVTVPASFNTDQRSDTLTAARWAGFTEVRLLDEPTAAFYLYFDQNRDAIDVDSAQKVLVFDFGGGTLDVSIIRIERRGAGVMMDPIGRSRYNNLGGDDIDADLASFLIALWEKRSGQAISSLSEELRRDLFLLFLRKAELFKEEFEDYMANGLEPNEFSLSEPIGPSGNQVLIDLNVRLSRAHYEEITGRFFENKSDVNIYKPIGQALGIANSISKGFEKSDIDLVLYTGGASRMSAVKACLEYYFAPKACVPISYEEACHTVALGAACCQYDEMHHHRGVTMRHRLLECVLTRTEDGSRFVPIVPLTAEPSNEFSDVAHEFRAARAVVNLRLPLFRGSGPHDHNLSPMQDLEFQLDRIVQPGTPYRLKYRVTSNKTIEIGAVFTPSGSDPIEVMGEVDITGTLTRGVPVPDLGRVNHVEKR